MTGKPRKEDLAFHFVPPNVDRSWMQRGRCHQYARLTTTDGLPHPMAQAWFLMSPREKRVVDGHLFTGQQLTDFALMNCEICPVQWDCARYAVEVNEQGSTWSMPIDDLRWLIKTKRALEVIAIAEAENVAMQRAVTALRNHGNVTTCQPSPPPSSTTTTRRNSTTSNAVKSSGRRRRRESPSMSGATSSVAS